LDYSDFLKIYISQGIYIYIYIDAVKVRWYV